VALPQRLRSIGGWLESVAVPERIQVSSLSWSGSRPWMVRAMLLYAAWRGLSSESEVVSTLSTYAFFALLPSFGQLLRRKKRVAQVHLAGVTGDARIVLREAEWRDWGKIKRVLHDDLDIDYPTSRAMFRDLPVTLEPAVPRSHADSVVAKLSKAGAVATVVTVDHEESLK
jgi:hypothetical protein